MLKMSKKRDMQKELLRSQSTSAKASLLPLKRDPPHRHYRYHRRPPPETLLKTATATTSSTRTEGFASLAAFDDPLGLSSRRCLRMLQRSERKSRRDSVKVKTGKSATRRQRTHHN